VQLRKGVLDMCVLALLARQDGYAYDIASRLAAEIGMGEGTIYPLMRRMQTDGLVKTYRTGVRRRPVFAVKKLSLKVPAGSIVAFVGPNAISVRPVTALPL